MKLPNIYKFSYRVQLVCAVIMLACATVGNAQVSTKPFIKNTFKEKDVFKSAVFLQNKEIIEPYNGEKVLYYLNHDQVNAYFTEKGVIYKVMSVDTNELNEKREEQAREKNGRDKDEDDDKKGPDGDEKPAHVLTSIITMEWIGANPHPEIVVTDKGEGYYTYLKPDGKTFKTLITEGYKNLVYKNLYPGIDAQYNFPAKGGVEYSLIVHPGANTDVVKMVYNGQLLGLSKNAAGDVVVHTNTGNLIEHAPVSFTGSQKNVASEFAINNNSIQFKFPAGYNHNETLTIDPWITALTTLPPVNIGMKVDYDYLGDLFVYGAGPTSWTDVTDFFEVAKYTTTGTMIWVFSGTVAGTWNTADGSTFNYPGGFRVDRITGKPYVSQGFCYTGTQTIRLTTAGTYDNFISTVNPSFNEAWGIMYNCATETIMDVGGGTSGSINMGIINTGSGSVTPSNITGLASTNQDIICATYDSAGSMYVVMNDDIGILPFTNTIYKVNAGYNGNIWSANSGYSPYNEAYNQPYWAAGENGNWSNCLAANGNYLFYYDGFNLAAHNLTTGAMVGTPTSITGYTPLMQGGIAVDRCNNLYLGGIGKIICYTFNGATFIHGTDISLGGAYASDVLQDVSLNTSTNKLFVAGTVVGTFLATPSISCVTPSNFSVSSVSACNSSEVHVTPSPGLSPLQFTYILFDTMYNIVDQQTNLSDTIADFTGLNEGKYFVQVQWNANCGGVTINDTIITHCDSISPDTSICQGGTAILSAKGLPSGGTYLWTPGGATDSIITVTPADTTTYYVTYTPPIGVVWTDSVTVFVLQANATVTVSDTAICQGDTATLYATPSQSGGTYLWSPGAGTAQSITVSPSTTTSYQVVFTGVCNSPANTGTVTVQPRLTLALNNDTICESATATIIVTPSVGGGTYAWAPGGYNTQAINVSPVIAGNYTYTVTYAQGLCSVIDSASVTVAPMPTLTIANDTICQGSMGSLTAMPSLTGGTYSWTPGNYSTPTISVSPNDNTQYNLAYGLAGCTALDSAMVIVDSMPVLTMTGDSICIGNAGQVSVSPSVLGGTYMWAPIVGITSSITDNPTLTSTYTVTYTSQLCTVTGSATITVLPQPTVSVIGDTVCSGSPVQLTAVPSRGTGTYLWAPGAFQTATVTVSPATTTVFTVTYTIAGCGSATDSATVKDWPYPTLVTNDTAFCNGFSGQLSAVPSINGGNYVWSPGAEITAAITVSPTATTVYTVTYEVNNCSVTGNATATVHDNPTVQISPANATCGVSNGTETANVSGGTPSYTYLWSNAATTRTITLLAGNLTYQVTVLDIYGCSVSALEFISQSTAVSATATGFNERCPGYTNGSAFVAAQGGLTPYTYAWSNQQSTDSVFNLAPGTYIVTVTDITGCSISASAMILDALADSFTIATQPTSCYGLQYQDGGITVTPFNMLRMPYQYALDGGTNQPTGSFANLAYGPHNATVVDDSGCINNLDNIIVEEAAEAFLTINPADTTIALGQSVQLVAALSPYTDAAINSYAWSPFFGINCTDCISPVVTSYANSTTYTLAVVYNGHCTVSDSAIVNITGKPQVFIPDVFTPNGDGMNDVFYIYGNDIRSVDLKVFNRWGEKVFESHDQFNGWDGFYKSELQPIGVYVYEATIYFLNGESTFKAGSVTLVR